MMSKKDGGKNISHSHKITTISSSSGDSTWELEETIRETYPYLFSGKSIFGDENFSCWGECKDLENYFRVEVVYFK